MELFNTEVIQWPTPSVLAGSCIDMAMQLPLCNFRGIAMTRQWTPFEDNQLRRLTSCCTIGQIARLLKRTPYGVYERAHKLGITVTKDVRKVLGEKKWVQL